MSQQPGPAYEGVTRAEMQLALIKEINQLGEKLDKKIDSNHKQVMDKINGMPQDVATLKENVRDNKIDIKENSDAIVEVQIEAVSESRKWGIIGTVFASALGFIGGLLGIGK